MLASLVLDIRYKPLYGIPQGKCVDHGFQFGSGRHEIEHLLRPEEMQDVVEMIQMVHRWQAAMHEDYRIGETIILLADYLEDLVAYVVGAENAHVALHCMVLNSRLCVCFCVMRRW